MNIILNRLAHIGCCFFAVICFSSSAYAQETSAGASLNLTAIATFLLFIAATLMITRLASKRTNDSASFYAAGGGIPAWQNGVAIAGDFMSAATLLGITGLMFFTGYDGYILAFGLMVAWPIMLMVIAERFRNLGKFTFVDVVTYRLKQPSMRIVSAIASMSVVVFYLIGQMVGAGKLIELLFGFDYVVAILLVTGLMMCYVIFGGMIATTWVQMIKAILLLSGGLLIAFLLLQRFGFDFSKLLQASIDVHPMGSDLLVPGGWLNGNLYQVLTVGLTMCFGIMGLPHILMRFFTVKDAAAARSSVSIATILMGVFYFVILVLGLGAPAILWGNPEYLDETGSLIGGSNLVALHVSEVVGGDILLGYMSAVTFATILAVVAGLTLSGSATIAHDLYGAFKKTPSSDSRNELYITRIAAFSIGLIALILGIAFEKQNIAVVTSLALAIAASVNFPILLLAMYWKDLTSRGAVFGGGLTLLVCFVLIVLSDGVWVQILGNEKAIFPFVYPTILTMPLGFISIVIFSYMDRSSTASAERERFPEQFYRSETGVGASGASDH